MRVIEELLLGWGIAPLHLITGQGHHFVWRVGFESEVARRIAGLEPDPELSRACHARAGSGVVSEISLEMQEAFAAMALVMEYLAHRIKWFAAPLSAVPVEITAVHVGPGEFSRREMVSIDVSEYGDPLHTRMIRMPYTNYLKPWLAGLVPGGVFGESLPQIRAIPHFGMVIHKLSGHLHLIHVNDNRGDRDDHLAPGEGHIDWPWLISELKRCHFDGTLILELSSHENESVPDMLARARQARDFLNRLM